jgi:hypothetical protein
MSVCCVSFFTYTHDAPPPPKHTHRQRTRCRWNCYGAFTVMNSWKMYAIPPPHPSRTYTDKVSTLCIRASLRTI